MAFDIKKIREDFPILKRKMNGKPLIYFDNAATSQKPAPVIDAEREFYEKYNANIHRSIHRLGEEATKKYEEAHDKASKFINAGFEEVVFTSGTTESLNLLAYSLGSEIKEGDEMVISQAEHHSNFVQWQQLAKNKRAKLKFAEITDDGTLDLGQLSRILNKKTRIVSLFHVSNVLGTINPIKKISKIIKEKSNACFIVDAAQSAPHMKLNVKELGCDFLAFSGHKMLAPTGIGVLYGKQELLEKMQPFMFGGEMIKHVTFEDTKFNDLPWKFEAGTANIAQAIGLGAAIDYLNKAGMQNIERHDAELAKYCYRLLDSMGDVEIYGPEERNSLVSFNVKNVHAHDTAAVLDSEGIAVRAGHHCAMPLHSLLGIPASARASFYLYNTKEEIDALGEGLKKVSKVFS
ncbi:cysteine desulfurase [Candidatus Woesearchaeota archaeon]|nr:cysteine desulfurase [Candidatus Woesearchaeota archaeon]